MVKKNLILFLFLWLFEALSYAHDKSPVKLCVTRANVPTDRLYCFERALCEVFMFVIVAMVSALFD